MAMMIGAAKQRLFYAFLRPFKWVFKSVFLRLKSRKIDNAVTNGVTVAVTKTIKNRVHKYTLTAFFDSKLLLFVAKPYP